MMHVGIWDDGTTPSFFRWGAEGRERLVRKKAPKNEKNKQRNQYASK